MTVLWLASFAVLPEVAAQNTPAPTPQTTPASATIAPPQPGAAAAGGATKAPAGGSTDELAKPGNGGVASAAAALKGADESSVLLAQIRKLPPLTGTSIDVGKRSAEIRQHLNAVLRFYRAAMVPIQKIGEPSDVLYEEQSQSESTQITELAFQAAKNEAALLAKVPGNANQTQAAEAQAAPQEGAQVQHVSAVLAQAGERLTQLQQQEASLEAQIAKARGSGRATLLQQQQQLQGGIELQQAMVEALNRINSFSAQQQETGLAGDIERLQRSAPELLSKPVKTPAPPVLQSLSAARDAGVSTQAGALFQLLATLHTIDTQIKAIDSLSQQAVDLRTPFVKVLRSTIQQGQTLTQQSVNLQATPTTDAQDLANTRKQFDQLTNTFQVLADATLPLSQEAVLLDNARGTLTTWQATADAEYKDILRHLLIRIAFIAVALGVLAMANRMLSQAAVRYVSDLRRRRQLLLLRRIVIGFFTGLVLIFGFVTQFSSLATFAGFISAGIAVGLQSILLSVAAYFFIVGRYGVKVGDRITVAGVTGEVIEVGLVRFYMMELVGTGTALHSTGRVAVFANSVLFQTGTPIYKQMPGTEYAWHELTAKLNRGTDVQATSAAILQAVNDVYETYSSKIQSQHQQVESWMGTALPSPKVESRLELADGGLQFAVLFPVQIDDAAETDQRIAETMLRQMNTEGALKSGVADLPIIKAAVKS
ncbi:MAG TPA: hypothetical protein VKV02_08345 [Acidobacteriaceae bacterium]|nr:hypothetical protein [Acidobacteriaceae bacterium]